MKITQISFILLLGLSILFISCKKKDSVAPFTFTGASTLEGNVNDEITLSGSGMSSSAVVKFGEVEATEKSGGGNSLKVRVPNGSTRGKISVSQGGTTFTSEQNFTTKNYLQRIKNIQNVDEDIDINLVYNSSNVWFGKNLHGVTRVGGFPIPGGGTIPDLRVEAYRTWDEALTACPQGWRLPSETDYATEANAGNTTTQESYVLLNQGRLKMKFTGYSFNDQLLGESNAGWYWTSNQGVNSASGRVMFFSSAPNTFGPFGFFDASKQYKCCVRCIKDLP